MGAVIRSGAYDAPDFLNKIKQLTMAMTPLTDMAILLDMDEMALSDLLENRASAASKVYRRTRAEIRLSERMMIKQLAEAGSPTAIEAMRKYMADSEI